MTSNDDFQIFFYKMKLKKFSLLAFLKLIPQCKKLILGGCLDMTATHFDVTS